MYSQRSVSPSLLQSGESYFTARRSNHESDTVPSFRLVGAIRRRRKIVSFYFSMICAQIIVALGSGILDLVQMFRGSSEQGTACSSADLDKFTQVLCGRSTSVKVGTIIILLFVWSIEIGTSRHIPPALQGSERNPWFQQAVCSWRIPTQANCGGVKRKDL